MKASELKRLVKNSLREIRLNEIEVMPDANGNCDCNGRLWSNCVGADGACSKGCCEWEGSPEQWATDNPLSADNNLVCADGSTPTVATIKPGINRDSVKTQKTPNRGTGKAANPVYTHPGAGGLYEAANATNMINEAEVCWCPPGSEPGTGSANEPDFGVINCTGGCAACCKGIRDLLAKKGEAGTGKSIPSYNGANIGAKDLPDEPSGGEAPQGKTMGENNLNERFQQLAGIKSLYENEGENEGMTKEELLNEGPELWTALGGLVGLIGAAGITTQLQMMAEDPAIAEKYPKLEKVFSFLSKVGGSLAKGIK